MLEDLRKEYQAQLDAYIRLKALASRQSKLGTGKDLQALKEIAGQKEKIFEEISLRENYLTIIKKEICQILSIEEFNLSSLKNKQEGEEVELLGRLLQEIGQELKELEKIEAGNEEKLKKILKRN